ncbi:hypothetical protein PGT21_003836 [Puccinia graminis f. sp. tritici]|uniref:HAT C-terminal dimerisation domain-containing protein n=1 Tax=Puccinia graminis f. sp. tritici TaxID=56615 RepID=A0A5B0Q4K1_PUCGR|nr:hypothetical protein PGT21_003836 [Puccinia graminis f. sp. tritici]
MVLMIPATSIALESAFSTSGRVLGDFQSRMAANTLKALVCGQDWFRSEEDVNNNKDDEEEEGDDDIELVE